MFKPILIAVCLALPLMASAADEKKPNEQQSRMAACNKQAGEKDLKGDDRKKFMSNCLSGGDSNPQHNKMTACNKEAGDKKLAGDERKKFMSACLSAQPAKAAPAPAAAPASQQDKMTLCNKTAGEKALKGDDRKKFMQECLSK